MAKDMYQKREERRIKAQESAEQGPVRKNIINWFPGHMMKALRMMQDSLKQVDCIIYVLDARAIISSYNSKFDSLINNKPVLYIVNKIDLVQKKDLDEWKKYYANNKIPCVFVDSISGRGKQLIIDKLKEINSELIERYAKKGVNKVIRAMVLGIPNCGKSTIINSLSKQKKAITGNRPGVTRGKQWISLAENIDLLDTPGTLPPSFDDQSKAIKLAFIGSIKEDVLRIDDIAIEIIKYFRANEQEAFKARYRLENFSNSDLEVFDDIAKSRGFILNKNNYDYDRVAKTIIDDFRKQKLGLVMLDKVK